VAELLGPGKVAENLDFLRAVNELLVKLREICEIFLHGLNCTPSLPGIGMIQWFNHPKDELLRDLALPATGTPVSSVAAQNLSLAVALRGTGRVSPNPLVGAVLVDGSHRFIAAAAHEKVGEPHAEANILRELRDSGKLDALRGGRMYVTLEPCAHEGRTPACARSLAGLGLKEVIYGMTDPNPLVSGKGAGILAGAGVHAVNASTSPEYLSWSAACADLASVFLHNISTGRLFTGLKIASSLDGVVAFQGDRRVWITNERARAYGHWLRMVYDAVAVGAGTVLADHPRLNVRHPFIADPVMTRTPRRVVFDPDARALEYALGSKSMPLVTEEPEKTIWLVADRKWIEPAEARGIKVVVVPVRDLPEAGARSRAFIWDEVDGVLQGLGVRSLLLEGGPGVYSMALGNPDPRTRPQLNRLHLFQAPVILGGLSPAGAKALRWNSAASTQQMIRQDRVQLFQLDGDWGVEIPFRDCVMN